MLPAPVQIGFSPKQYIQNAKQEEARVLLETTDMDIQTIAQWMGYGDPFAFSHAFKQNTGISPRKWRKRHCDKNAEK